jgi:hypothetical protein
MLGIVKLGRDDPISEEFSALIASGRGRAYESSLIATEIEEVIEFSLHS